MQEKEEKEIKFEFYNEKLFEFRKNKNLSQEELAEKIGVSRQSIYAWESGKSVPDIENMSKLCQILEIKANDLTNGLNIGNDNEIENNKLEIKKSKLKEYKKVLVLILGIIFLIYLIMFLKKLIILERLDYLQDKLWHYDNYSYTIMWENTTGGNDKFKMPIREDVKYKNKIIKMKNDQVNEQGIIESTYRWVDTRSGEGWQYNTERKTYEKIMYIGNLIEHYNAETIRVISGYNGTSNNIFQNILFAISPDLKIKTEGNKWCLERISKNKNGFYSKHQDYFYKDTGLPFGKWNWYDNNNYICTRYGIDIGNVTDEDIAKPDFTGYTYIELETQN